jgi:hypothetical protein
MNHREFGNFNIEHVHRIIEATRSPDRDVLVDREGLLIDLINCFGKYNKAIKPGVPKRHTGRYTSLRKHIARMVKLIRKDDDDLGVIHKLSEGTSEILLDQLFRFDHLLEHALQSLPEAARVNRERQGLTVPARQALVGVWLARAYEKHFKREALSGRSPGGRPHGPYVRFALKATEEMKIKCSDETIHKALWQEKKTKKYYLDSLLAGNIDGNHLEQG